MSLSPATLSELEQLAEYDPAIARMTKFITTDSYEEFVHAFYDDLDSIVDQIQEHRQHHQGDSEDRLTIEIVTNLVSIGYNASHDTQHGGHVDLLVKRKKFKWLGEAKIHSSYDYLLQGFNQLTTRYSIGSPEENHGGLVIYIKNKNAKTVMETWKERLKQAGIDNLSTSACPKKMLAFQSQHTHEVSGASYNVRHLPVLLYFSPKDH